MKENGEVDLGEAGTTAQRMNTKIEPKTAERNASHYANKVKECKNTSLKTEARGASNYANGGAKECKKQA